MVSVWGCFVSVILITLLSMAISELLADYNIEVIDRALEAAKEAKPVPDELPFYPEAEHFLFCKFSPGAV
jgi:hypothetical protein